MKKIRKNFLEEYCSSEEILRNSQEIDKELIRIQKGIERYLRRGDLLLEKIQALDSLVPRCHPVSWPLSHGVLENAVGKLKAAGWICRNLDDHLFYEVGVRCFFAGYQRKKHLERKRLISVLNSVAISQE